jgi:arylsulfatase A-like enzyme
MIVSSIKSYWKISRIIFALFSLYLMGDAFFRWDGFKHYAPLSDYLLSLALAMVLWSILALITALLIWLPFRLCEWVCNGVGLKITIDHLSIYMVACSLLGAFIWKGKKLFWPDTLTTFQLKIAVLVSVFVLSIVLVYLLRNKVGLWIDIIQERITPLVWLFGVLAISSVIIVAYYTSVGSMNKAAQQVAVPLSTSDEKRHNILLITFDALSARNMSLYGYHRLTTPFISKWAEDATVFDRAESVSNYTAPTTASMMTGKNAWTHLRYNRMQGSKPIKTDIESLPLRLKQYGYYNMMFIANIIASADNLGITSSIDFAPLVTEFWNINNLQGKFNELLISLFADKFRIYNWILREDFITGKLIRKFEKDESYTRFPPELAFNSFLDFIDANHQQPFFAWIHLDPPHYPYLPPEPFVGMFDQSGEMNTLKSQSEGKTKIQKAFSLGNSSPRDIEILRARYDEFIRYSDKRFEEFINQLETRNLMENTIIILSADHGETFEHNSLLHGSSLYEPETNIPLIIKEPDRTEGRTIDDVVSQIDIPATILDLADIPLPSWIEGRSLVPLMHGNKLPARPSFSMNLEKNRMPPSPVSKGTIVVWEDDYKLMYFLEKDESLLFNLKQDANEMHNLINEKPKLGRRLLGFIKESLEQANERIVSGE